MIFALRCALVVTVFAALSASAQTTPPGETAPVETTPFDSAPAEGAPVEENADGLQAPPTTEVPEPAAPAPAPPADPHAPILEDIRFENRTYFREETLASFVRHPKGAPLDVEVLESAARDIASRFQERGYLSATVALRLEPGERPRGKRAVFVLTPGERAELREVHVTGNKLVDEKVLREGFFSRPPEPLGFLTRAGFFHRPYLDQDGQRLVANYYRFGHLEARVTGTRVEATSDLTGLVATFDVVEGPVYELTAIAFDGDLPPNVPLETLRAGITIKDGDIADLVTIQRDSDALLEPWREAGYPFARFQQAVEVTPPPSGRADRRAIILKLTFVKGDAARVRMVRIVGNKGTQEHVIRRDVTVLEDKPYDHKAVKETQLRVMRTGFFQAVVARAIPTERPDIVDVEVAVTEQPTWLANLAPAFLGSEGLILIGIAADRNLFGTGLAASAVGQFSQLRQLFDLSLTEPRLFDTRIAISGEVHRRDLAYDGFHVKSEVGGGLRAGFPLPVNGLSVGGGLGVEYGGVTPDASLVLEGLAPSLFPRDVFRNVVSVNLTYDARDSVLAPRRGVYTELAMSYAGPATLSGRPGTFDHLGFLSSSANARLFWSPLWDITLKSNTELGFVFNPHGGDVPVTDRFFLGGLGSVRGYIPRSIGPGLAARANVVKRAADGGLVETGEQVDVTIGVGGVVELVQNLELEFPIWPGTPFRGFLFCDAGNAFTEQELAMLGTSATPERGTGLRHWLMWSTGFGLLVETPVAPLRFQFSFPLTRRTTRAVVDNPVDFFFGIGSAF